jgi:hypothetical protein
LQKVTIPRLAWHILVNKLGWLIDLLLPTVPYVSTLNLEDFWFVTVTMREAIFGFNDTLALAVIAATGQDPAEAWVPGEGQCCSVASHFSAAPRRALLCSAVLCCAVLCCAVLCCAVLCCVVLTRPMSRRCVLCAQGS